MPQLTLQSDIPLYQKLAIAIHKSTEGLFLKEILSLNGKDTYRFNDSNYLYRGSASVQIPHPNQDHLIFEFKRFFEKGGIIKYCTNLPMNPLTMNDLQYFNNLCKNPTFNTDCLNSFYDRITNYCFCELKWVSGTIECDHSPTVRLKNVDTFNPIIQKLAFLENNIKIFKSLLLIRYYCKTKANTVVNCKIHDFTRLKNANLIQQLEAPSEQVRIRLINILKLFASFDNFPSFSLMNLINIHKNSKSVVNLKFTGIELGYFHINRLQNYQYIDNLAFNFLASFLEKSGLFDKFEAAINRRMVECL